MSITNVVPFRSFDYVSPDDPGVAVNPKVPYLIWLNTTSGSQFICTDNTAGANVWAELGGAAATTAVNALDAELKGSAFHTHTWGNYSWDSSGTNSPAYLHIFDMTGTAKQRGLLTITGGHGWSNGDHDDSGFMLIPFTMGTTGADPTLICEITTHAQNLAGLEVWAITNSSSSYDVWLKVTAQNYTNIIFQMFNNFTTFTPTTAIWTATAPTGTFTKISA